MPWTRTQNNLWESRTINKINMKVTPWHSLYDNNWRECSKCNKYKLWDQYNSAKWWINWKKSECKDCRPVFHKKLLDSPKRETKAKLYIEERKLNTFRWDRSVEEWVIYQWQRPAPFIRFTKA